VDVRLLCSTGRVPNPRVYRVVLEDFIRRYGDSIYGTLARARLEELKKSQVAAVSPSATEVFVSYSRRDLATAQRVFSYLEARGYSVRREAQINTGEVWSNSIQRSVDAAGAVVVLWSAASVSSDSVRVEAQLAADKGKLIPVLIEPADIPHGFANLQSLDIARDRIDAADAQALSRIGEAVDRLTRGAARMRP
jgi:hypothetical protein